MRVSQLTLYVRNPEELIKWYSEKLGLQVENGCLLGPDFILVLSEGRAPESATSRFGLTVDTVEELRALAERVNATVEEGGVFAGFRAQDPEGNFFEAVCRLKA